MSKYWEKKREIINFKKGENESLYDAWERFKFLLKRYPTHDLSEQSYLQVFTKGLTHSQKMFLDASIGGIMRVKTDHEVQTQIENMAQNEYRAEAEKKKQGVFGVSESSATLANQTTMNKHIEA